jgi:hypothetical protein
MFQPASSQSERILKWVQRAMVFGLVVVAAQAYLAEPRVNGWVFLTVGTLAGLSATATGAAFGLLFGLPISTRVTVVNQSGENSEAARPRNDWFSDNTSMEQIADWLTKIIVGLTLTQWSTIEIQFNRVSAAVTLAMTGPQSAAARGDAGMVVGGVIVGAYFVLGFLLAYIWCRRYLSAELAAGRVDLLKEQRSAEEEFLARAAGVGAVQEARKDDSAKDQALTVTAVAQEHAQPEPVQTRPYDQIMEPGIHADDPWKGQFGGRSTDGGVEVTATVQRLKTQANFYAVELVIHAVKLSERVTLTGKEARIYLHPTFSTPIRVAKFGVSGEIKLPLVSYEAFTLGVHLSDGRLFELDLAELPGIPAEFKG